MGSGIGVRYRVYGLMKTVEGACFIKWAIISLLTPAGCYHYHLQPATLTLKPLICPLYYIGIL